LISLSLAVIVFSQEKTITAYKNYFNFRYGYCIRYPNKLLTPQREAQNGDGRIFTDKKGKEVLRVYGAQNDDESGTFIPLKKLYNLELKGGQYNEHPNRVITYSKLGYKFYVISGTENGKIFYQKTLQILRDEDTVIAVAMLNYSDADKNIYDQVSKKIFSSFKYCSD